MTIFSMEIPFLIDTTANHIWLKHSDPNLYAYDETDYSNVIEKYERMINYIDSEDDQFCLFFVNQSD